MDFTREPVVECVITPKEGFKLVVRSSKTSGQEEYFVDAVELVSFGNAIFYRSMERPKSFLVPASDYEVVEARETRVVLKAGVPERGAIKIGGGRAERAERTEEAREAHGHDSQQQPDRKKRRQRRRRGRDDREEGKEVASEEFVAEDVSPAVEPMEGALTPTEQAPQQPRPTVLPPPPTLIRDTIGRYKDDDTFKGAFYQDEPPTAETEESLPFPLPEPTPSANPQDFWAGEEPSTAPSEDDK